MNFSKLNVKSTANKSTRMDLSRSHLTTLDFNKIGVLFNEPVVPRDKYKVKCSIFSRVAPLVFPTYGKIDLVVKSFFVPYYLLMDDADSFMAGNKFANGRPCIGRFVNIDFVNYMLGNNGNSTDVDSFAFDSDVDFHNGVNNAISTLSSKHPGINFYYAGEQPSGDPILVAKRLTNRGRALYQILKSLGYDFVHPDVMGALRYKNHPLHQDIKPTSLNALPLLAFLQVYNDYLSQSVYYNSSQLTKFLHDVKTLGYGVGGVNTGVTSQGFLDASFLGLVFNELPLFYQNDYFTSAWQYPNMPADAHSNDVVTDFGTSNDIFAEQYKNNLRSEADGVALDIPVENTGKVATIDSYGMRLLTAFDKFVRKHNLAGSRPAERVYALFGVKPQDMRSQQSILLKQSYIPLQIGDITNMTDGQNNAALGSYAGKGIINGDLSFEIDVQDYGQIITLCYLMPRVTYTEGFSSEVLRTNPFDFYNPAFDGVTYEAIPAIALDTRYKSSGFLAQDFAECFGFANKYDSYRYGRDIVSGDFRLFSQFEDWHLGRSLDDVALVAQNVDFVSQSDATQFDRIFAIQSEDVDHFYLTTYFKVDAIRPMLSLTQSAGLDEGDINIWRNGANE